VLAAWEGMDAIHAEVLDLSCRFPEGKVVVFILGDASGWEYGVPESVGWIDTIGVHPDYQRKGVARALMSEMIDNLKKVGVIRSTPLSTGEIGGCSSSLMPWVLKGGT